MPVLLTGHGSPMNAVEKSSRARNGWRTLGRELKRPSVIIAVSAHWAARSTLVRTAADNPQIYDMYGFPEELYRVKYAPAGSPEYAEKVLKLLGNTAEADNSWGIDHGVWSVLCNLFPEADIPVVMVSTEVTASPEELYETGRKLKPLREEGALILASGNVVHNLSLVGWDMNDGYAWADQFDETIRDLILNRDSEGLLNYQTIHDWERAVPTPEHFDPLLIAAGAAEGASAAKVWNEYRELGSMSMTSYLWEN
ncbi:MAG: dioxygenase, partial [Bulleidia sp.]